MLGIKVNFRTPKVKIENFSNVINIINLTLYLDGH